MLKLTDRERFARARADFACGAPVIVSTPEGDAAAIAAEMLSAGRLEALRALGPLDLTVTARRARTLNARAYDGDLARIVADGVALARLRAAADPAQALSAPLIGPFDSRRAGGAAAHRLALRLARAARLLPAALVAPVPDGRGLARAHGLSLLTQDDFAPRAADAAMRAAIRAALPIAAAPRTLLHVIRSDDGAREHVALEIGAPSRDATPLTRLHSACFTGDVLGSLKCDCGPQLHAALAQIAGEGAGLLLYLDQEGRGIGLANKMRAYALQDQGFDTVDANHRLGFEDDERDFADAAGILKGLGFGAIRLLTNNPRKVAGMEAAGVSVAARAPLIVGRNPFNAAYLDAKSARSGHLL